MRVISSTIRNLIVSLQQNGRAAEGQSNVRDGTAERTRDVEESQGLGPIESQSSGDSGVCKLPIKTVTIWLVRSNCLYKLGLTSFCLVPSVPCGLRV